jgi:hypothetical protein
MLASKLLHIFFLTFKKILIELISHSEGPIFQQFSFWAISYLSYDIFGAHWENENHIYLRKLVIGGRIKKSQNGRFINVTCK